MRIYEFAKKQNSSSKELVELLRDAGFAVKSHMSLLSEDARLFLESAMRKKREEGASEADKKREALHQKKAPNSTKRPAMQHSKTLKNNTNRRARGNASGNSVATHGRDQNSRTIRQDSELGVARAEHIVLQPMSLEDLSTAAGISSSQLIILLMRWGALVAKNQVVSVELVERVAQEFDIPTTAPKVVDEHKRLELEEGVERRLPVVVVLGHVDHGKTTLLDFIRKSRVAAREKGGITQHLGAYEVSTDHGSLVFLDTPGHEAFTKIRQRGARVADIAILVVAADDSLMPQTLEAIKQIKQAKIPLVVAINKIDKVDPERIEIVKRDLAQHDLLPEEWGGNTVICPISAKVGTSVDELLELVSLQAELLEPMTTTKGKARGYVLEASMERGRGAAATVLLRQGRLLVGDYFKAGNVRGRVSSIVDSHGSVRTEVGPSIPVRVAGFEQLPEAGALLLGIDKAAYRKFEPLRTSKSAVARFIPENAIKLIIKTDTKSSKEALVDSIEKVSAKTSKQYGRGFHVIDADIGNISESDVLLAESSGASIYGLHVKASSKIKDLARSSGVSLQLFDIIYKLLEGVEEVARLQREVVITRKKVGAAEVRKVFPVKNLGVIAGCYVKDGAIVRDGYIVARRGSHTIGEGKIVSLQSERKNVKEARAGYECGFIVKEISDWVEGDIAECYIEVQE